MTRGIIQGDCLNVMRSLGSNSIDLIYLDPPFFTEKVHTLKNRERTQEFSFDDVFGSNDKYAKFLYARILLMRKLLKDDGTIFVHCDKSGAHIIRAILDEVFGPQNFRSEIIWSYKRWSNSKKGLLSGHQNIYFYSKSNEFTFNTILTPYSETTNIDQNLQRRTRDAHNKSVYDLDEFGTAKTGGRKKGVPLGDVWDIPYLNPKAKERVGYPTQKPILLLERIINLVTNEGDLILDPFCGSGTTCVAAKLLGREYIGIDQSSEAVKLSQARVDNPVKTESNLLRKGRESYIQVDKQALNLLNGLDYNPVHRNKGIDAILVRQYNGSPILVRVQKEGETIMQSASMLAKAMRKKQSLKSILIQTENHPELFDSSVAFKGMVVLKSLALQVSELVDDACFDAPVSKQFLQLTN